MKSRLIKIPENYRFPFKVNEVGFMEWFKVQTFKNYFDDSLTLFYILKILNIKLFPIKTRLLILHKISVVLPELSSYLVSQFINQSIPLQDKPAYCAELVAGIYGEISKGYHLLISSDEFLNKDSLSKQEKIGIIYDGLDALNNALINFSLSYSSVDVGFWQRTYDFFILAKELGLTKNKINPQGDCIENVFKSILAFYLSNPNQFNPDELLIISKLISHYSEYNRLLTPSAEKTFKRLPAIILNEDKPPKFSDISQAYENYVFYIATANLAAQILESTNIKEVDKNGQNSLSRTSLLRLVRSLTLNSRRKFERKQTEQPCSVIIGIYELCKFFSPKNVKSGSKALKIESIDNPMATSGIFMDKRLKEMGLGDQPHKNYRHDIIDDERLYALKDNPANQQELNIWDSDGNDLTTGNINENANKVVDISKTGLGIILCEPKSKLRIMSLMGIFDNNLSLFGIGLVRRITYVESLLKLGVELLATEICFIYVSSLLVDQEYMVEGILFSSQNENDTVEIIILPVINLSINQTVFITKSFNGDKKYYKVMGTLNRTTDYFHYKLGPGHKF